MHKDIVLLDNFDSFTYNIVDQLRISGNNVIIYRNKISLNTILLKLSNFKKPVLLLSPGPGKPKNAGCMLDLLSHVVGKIPVIGICLGYQAIVEHYGGSVDYSGEVVHGKSSLIHHDEKEMFLNITNPLLVARYHSLVCESIPKSLVINSVMNNMVMSVRNNSDKICGFQFHPESILTTYGTQLLDKTLNWTYS
ncbi:Anthranilate synthase component 2 [Buchnera aphidicola (Panaphis juglandis)]